MIPAAREVFFPARARSPEAQQEVETRFFRGLRLANGTYKTTFPGRLAPVDTLTADLLQALPSISVLDVAVSSGTTTVELMDALESRGLTTRVTATDLYLHAALEQRGPADVLVDRTGYTLQVALPFAVKCRPHDPGGSWRRRGLDRLMDWIGRPPGIESRPVVLVAQALRDRPLVHLEEQDLATLRPDWRGRFDLVRAANILNLDYFVPEVLQLMAGHLASYLRPGGLLVLCRTLDDRSNHATVFRKDSAGLLSAVARVGQGSEVESMLLTPEPST